MSGFKRGDAGMSAPGEAGFNLDLTTSAVTLDVPDHRYFKCAAAVVANVVFKLDTAAVSLPIQAGVNPERIAQIGVNAVSASIITFIK